MSKVKLLFAAEDKPANLADPGVIVQQCSEAARQAQSTLRGIPLVDESGPYAWVKYGRTITRGEAQTQDFVGEILNGKADAAVRVPCVYLFFRSGGFSYIVMEYIEGTICENSDAALVAAAVQALISIQSPTAQPGPVGGGSIKHRFFIDWESSQTYSSIRALEDHINGILTVTERAERVNFEPEVATYGLRLCPCDMNRINFMKDGSGRIVALDFGATCFLPTSFFAFALREGDNFTLRIAPLVDHPASTQLNAMLGASYALVPFGINNIGVPSAQRKKSK